MKDQERETEEMIVQKRNKWKKGKEIELKRDVITTKANTVSYLY